MKRHKQNRDLYCSTVCRDVYTSVDPFIVSLVEYNLNTADKQHEVGCGNYVSMLCVPNIPLQALTSTKATMIFSHCTVGQSEIEEGN